MPRVPSHCSAFISGVLSPEDIHRLPRPLGQRGGPGSQQVKAKALVLAEFTARASCRLGWGALLQGPQGRSGNFSFPPGALGGQWVTCGCSHSLLTQLQRGQMRAGGGKGQREERGTMTEGNGINKTDQKW